MYRVLCQIKMLHLFEQQRAITPQTNLIKPSSLIMFSPGEYNRGTFICEATDGLTRLLASLILIFGISILIL